MKLIEFNLSPTDRQLRQFGVICLFALPGICWLWGGGTTAFAILAATGLLLAVTGLVLPVLLKPIFLALMIIATPIGMIVGELAMLMIYFGVFLPLGLVFRIAQRDSLQRRFDRDAESYWMKKKQPTNSGSYYRQS